MSISVFGAHAGPAMAGPNEAFSVQGSSSDVYQGHLASAVGNDCNNTIVVINTVDPRLVEQWHISSLFSH